MSFHRRIFALLALSLAIASCSSDLSSSPAAQTPPPPAPGQPLAPWPVPLLTPAISSSRADFMLYQRDGGNVPWTGANLSTAMANDSIGVSQINGVTLPYFIGEWDWSGMDIPAAGIGGAGLARSGFPCFDSVQGCANPLTEHEALTRLQAYYAARVTYVPAGAPNLSFTEHYFFQHYQAEWGAQLIAQELGVNFLSTQTDLAFTRGASKQYLKPWGIDFSSWYGNSIRDYSGQNLWGNNSCMGGFPTCTCSSTVCGHSISLTSRTYFAAYMSGANFIMNDSGMAPLFQGTTVPLVLSPLGQASQVISQFAQAHQQRGLSYVPFAIVLDHDHGMGFGTWYTSTTWDTFSLDNSRLLTKSLFETIWPGAWTISAQDETNALANSPYGDSFDVLLENAPTDLMAHYPVLIATGHLANNPALIAYLKSYVSGGGILVLDTTSYAAAFLTGVVGSAAPGSVGALATSSAVGYQVGSGQVIVLQSAAAWGAVLDYASSKVQPFQLTVTSTDGSKTGPLQIEYFFNKISDTDWVVTLINNKGITKAPTSDEVFDASWSLNVQINAVTGHILSANSWRGTLGAVTSQNLTTTVPSGDVTVIEFITGP